MPVVNIKLDFSDDGSLKNIHSRVKELNKDLQAAKSLATGTKTGAAAAQASFRGEGTAYGQGRGAMGATGASGRDFAKEAQGLGGLVRLYATYAANLFAVSAAFNALREAMNTTNMIRGLDQLGAATGVAMGALAKRFAEASGGAISLRDSMEATAKAMSSGMSQRQFLQLGDVAKKASQALGVNMSDAVSRLTRGITKLEPELLDELGLFTKVGKASEEYARSVGKSVDSLTDFEKRQAFANAVLAEGRQKFNEIDIPTNPYDKLLASLTNAGQSILAVVNTAITPLVELLSKSPTALTAVILGLTALVVRQALPILTSYRAAMRKATEETAALAEEKAKSAKRSLEIARAAREKEQATVLAGIDEAKTAQVDAADAALRKAAKSGLSKEVKAILAEPSVMNITKQQLDTLDKLGEKNTKVAARYRDLAASIREAQKSAREFDVQREAARKRIDAPPEFGSPAYAAQINLEKARKQAASANILSNVGQTASEVGYLTAFSKLYDGIKTEKLGVLKTAFVGLAGTATILATAMGNLLVSFTKFFNYIAVATVIYELLDFAFSKNSKQLEVFNQALSFSEENVKASTLTYKKFGEQLTVQSILANAQAFTNLTDSISGSVEAFKDLLANSSAFDKFVEGFKNLFGFGAQANLSKSLAEQINAGLKNITDPKLRAEASKNIQDLLGTENLTTKNIERVADGITKTKLVEKGQAVADVFRAVELQTEKASAKLRETETAFKALDISYQELANSILVKDPLTNFGRDLAQASFKLDEAFKDPITSSAQLRDILTDISKLKLLSPEAQTQLTQVKADFNDLANQLAVYEKQVAEATVRIGELRTPGLAQPGKAKLIAEQEAKISAARGGISNINEQMKPIAESMRKATADSIETGFKLIQTSFSAAMAQGVITAQKGLLDKLPRTAETAMLSAELENKKIDIQIKQITTTEALIKEMELGRVQAERIHLEQQRDRALEKETEANIRAGISRTAEEKIAPLREREKVLGTQNIGKAISAGDLKRTPETLAALMREQGTAAKIQDLANTKQLNTLNALVEADGLRFEASRKFFQDSLKDIEARKQDYQKSTEFRDLTLKQQQDGIENYLEEERVIQKQLTLLDARKERSAAAVVLEKAASQGAKDGWDKIATAAQTAVDVADRNLKVAENTFDVTQRGNKSERDRTNELARQAEAYALRNIEIERGYQLQRIADDTSLSLLGIEKDLLATQLDQGTINIDYYNQQILALEKLERLKQYDLKLKALDQKYTSDLTVLAKELAEATTQGKRAEIAERRKSIDAVYNAEVDALGRVYSAQERSKSLVENLTDRQKAYGDIFKNTFEGMADSILNFVKTGKFEFKGLIDSFISDLVRYELRLQALELYKAMRPGLMSGIGGLFGQQGFLNEAGGMEVAGSLGFAKGGVFDAGLQMFARGGVVDSPTLFKFAKGAGMMGEAGPEAIMPLTRDGQGNLGVRAPGQQGKVDVIVNNYSSEQATAEEITDSRGNRRIEVTIGDMTAEEITRSGSGPQRAIKNTFGLQTKLIRR